MFDQIVQRLSIVGLELTVFGINLYELFLELSKGVAHELGLALDLSNHFDCLKFLNLFLLNLTTFQKQLIMNDFSRLPLGKLLQFCGFGWEYVGTKDHLSEAIVVHVLEDGSFFGGVDVDSFGLFVDVRVELSSSFLAGHYVVVLL